MGISKVNFGNETLIDLTGDSVTPDTLMPGVTAHDAKGEPIVGAFPHYETTLPSSGTALADGTVYEIATPITNFSWVAPSTGNRWSHGFINITGTPNMTFESTAQFLYRLPGFVDGGKYEFDVYRGVWAWAEVKDS